MSKKHLWFDCLWTFKIKRKGKVIWEESKKNSLADLGERNMLESYFKSVNSPTQFFIRLANDVLIDTDTLPDILGEPVGNGYAPQLVERSGIGFPTIELDDGDFRIVSKEVNFKAVGGDIGPITIAYLATTSDDTGLLISSVPLTIQRTILDNDEGFISIRIKLK